MATRKPIKTPTAYRKPAGESTKSGNTLTSERISDGLEAVRKSGGHIEVLGTTRVLTRLDEPEKKPGK